MEDLSERHTYLKDEVKDAQDDVSVYVRNALDKLGSIESAVRETKSELEDIQKRVGVSSLVRL